MYSAEGKAAVRSLESRVECCRDPLSSSSFLAVSGENVNSRADASGVQRFRRFMTRMYVADEWNFDRAAKEIVPQLNFLPLLRRSDCF